MLGNWKKVRRVATTTFLIATVIFGVIGDTTTVLAQGNREDYFDPTFYAGNEIYFTNPDANVCKPGDGKLAGGSTKEKIWNFLIANDLSAEQAAGLMGNMQVESGFIPVRYQGDRNFDPWTPNQPGEGKGWGLVQWDGGRRLAILNKIKSHESKSHLAEYVEFEYNGIAEPNEKFRAEYFDELLLFELEYMMQESIARPVTASGFPGGADKEWERMKQQPTLADATEFWERNFEVAGKPNIPQRISFAQAILDEFGDNLSATGSGTAGCADARNIQELALAYAWPEYHPPDYPRKKPAYAEATQASIAAGGYVGTRMAGYEGVDCGGFVTQLIVNSGYDTSYNENKGDTSVQLQWLRDNWTRVGVGGEPGLSSKLEQAGVAVAIYHNGTNGHTFIYLGEEMVELGFGGEGSGAKPGIASSSYLIWRAPMAGNESILSDSYEWFVKG